MSRLKPRKVDRDGLIQTLRLLDEFHKANRMAWTSHPTWISVRNILALEDNPDAILDMPPKPPTIRKRRVSKEPDAQATQAEAAPEAQD